MEGPATTLLLRIYNDLPDPRARNRSHLLSDIVTIAILGVLAGAEGWEDIEDWAQSQEEFLKTFLALPHGIPSHDTFEDIFRRIDPEAFERCFLAWSNILVQNSREQGEKGRLVAIDGKTLRHSFDHAWQKTPIHMVSAFATENQIVLGQLKVDSKENEIIAIPKLLELLDVRGCTVTIDAMGCQKEIARQIRSKKAQYVLALKENHPTLHQAVVNTFAEARLEKFVGWTHDYTESVEAGHGRTDTRRVWVTNEIKHLKERKEWKDLSCIVMVESTRRMDNGKSSTEARYYLASHKKLDARSMAHAVRRHWGIENQQHYVLDVTMNEDACRIRKGNGAQNVARLRRIALNQLRKVPVFRRGREIKVSLKRKRKMCSYDLKFLMSALLA